MYKREIYFLDKDINNEETYDSAVAIFGLRCNHGNQKHVVKKKLNMVQRTCLNCFKQPCFVPQCPLRRNQERTTLNRDA